MYPNLNWVTALGGRLPPSAIAVGVAPNYCMLVDVKVGIQL